MEAVYPDRRRFKETIGDYIGSEPIGGSGAQSSDRDMRDEFSLFLLDPGMGECGFDLLVELKQWFGFLNSDPECFGSAARREEADPFERELEGVHIDGVQCTAGIGKNAAIDLPDKSKCQMKLLRLKPTCTGQATTYPDQLVRDIRWQVNSDK